MHLVGVIITIYQDARPPERQILYSSRKTLYSTY